MLITPRLKVLRGCLLVRTPRAKRNCAGVVPLSYTQRLAELRWCCPAGQGIALLGLHPTQAVKASVLPFLGKVLPLLGKEDIWLKKEK